jgi:hypothetical protein
METGILSMLDLIKHVKKSVIKKGSTRHLQVLLVKNGGTPDSLLDETICLVMGDVLEAAGCKPDLSSVVTLELLNDRIPEIIQEVQRALWREQSQARRDVKRKRQQNPRSTGAIS